MVRSKENVLLLVFSPSSLGSGEDNPYRLLLSAARSLYWDCPGASENRRLAPPETPDELYDPREDKSVLKGAEAVCVSAFVIISLVFAVILYE
jgi:hypothetical protein